MNLSDALSCRLGDPEEDHDEGESGELQGVVFLQELVERSTSIDLLFVVIGIFSEELLCLFARLFLLNGEVLHRLVVLVVGLFVRVNNSTFNENYSIYFRVVSLAFFEFNDDFVIDDSSMAIDTIHVELAILDSEVDEDIGWEELAAGHQERVHALDDVHITDLDVECFHAWLPEVTLGELEDEGVLAVCSARDRHLVLKIFAPALRMVDLHVGHLPAMVTAATGCLTASEVTVCHVAHSDVVDEGFASTVDSVKDL